MGLDDRDSMRGRNQTRFDGAGPRPFEPPPEREPWLFIVLFWVSIAFLLYKGVEWWMDHQQPRQSPTVDQQGPPSARAAPRSDLPVTQPAVPVRPQSSLAPSTAAPSGQSLTPAPRTGGTIYLCRSYGGTSFWAADHCNQHNALIERIASVPAGMSFQQQVQIAEQQRHAATAAAAVHAVPAATPDPAFARKGVCTALDQRVNHLDAMARQPQSAQTQDWIRSERQQARDEQFRLRC